MLPYSFLQSKEWEEFQHSLGRKTWRVDSQTIIQHKLPLGFNYLYSPRPHIESADSFFAKAQAIGKKEKAVFLKIDPNSSFVIANRRQAVKQSLEILRSAQDDASRRIAALSDGYRGARNDIKISNPLQPPKTAILDLSKSEEELLAAMHEKTRYNIRLAERKGVGVKNFQFSIFNFQNFWGLLQETALRDSFHTHERQYYEKLLAIKSENFSNELFFAEYHGKVLAAALVNFYRAENTSSLRGSGATEAISNIKGLLCSANSGGARNDESGAATYLNGASSREHKEVMAPYLLHWRIIQEAKRRGFQNYDFWGIDELRWPGVTRFKKGFGGDIVAYPESVDVVYKQGMYMAYRITRALNSYR